VSCACGASITNDLFLCRRCGRDLRGHLLAVPDLFAELETTRYRLDRMTVGQRDSSETPVAWSEDAARAAQRLEAAVLDMPVPPGPSAPHTPEHRAVWLAERVTALRGCDGVADAAGDLSEAVSGARATIDRPDMRARFVVGPCPMPGAKSGPCPGQVWAHLPHDGPAVLECRVDDAHRWTAERWARAGRMILRRLADLNQMQAAG
jgi:hypothetical protein